MTVQVKVKRMSQSAVHSWEPVPHVNNDRWVAVYALGDKPDARRPRRLTNAERCRAWKARVGLAPGHRPPPNSVWQLGAMA